MHEKEEVIYWFFVLWYYEIIERMENISWWVIQMRGGSIEEKYKEKNGLFQSV